MQEEESIEVTLAVRTPVGVSFITRVNCGLMQVEDEIGKVSDVDRGPVLRSFITRVNCGLMQGRSGPAGFGLYRARTTNPDRSKSFGRARGI